MKFTFQVLSIHAQAKNWIAAGLKRNLTCEENENILKVCKEVGKELGFRVKRVKGIFVFSDKKGSK